MDDRVLPCILVADDDILLRLAVGEILGNLGRDIIETTSACDTLAVLRLRPVAVLFTDRGDAGIELGVRARDIQPSVSVIFGLGNHLPRANTQCTPLLNKLSVIESVLRIIRDQLEAVA
jgi:two-component SAPR family response regulator